MNKSVMIISNDITLRKNILKILSKYTDDFIVTGDACQPIEGLDLMQSIRPDIVLIEYNLLFLDIKQFLSKAGVLGLTSQYILMVGQQDIVENLWIDRYHNISGCLYTDNYSPALLLKLVIKASTDIDKRLKEDGTYNRKASSENASIENFIKRNSQLGNIIHGVPEKEFAKTIIDNAFDIDANGAWIAVAEPRPHDTDTFSFFLYLDYIQECFKGFKSLLSRFNGGEIFLAGEQRICFLINRSTYLDTKTINKLMTNVMNELDFHGETTNLPPLYFSISKQDVAQKNYFNVYQQLLDLSHFRFFCSNNRIVNQIITSSDSTYHYHLLLPFFKEINNTLNQNDLAGCELAITNLFSQLKQLCSFQVFSLAWNWLLYKCFLLSENFSEKNKIITRFALGNFSDIGLAQIAINDYLLHIIQAHQDNLMNANPIINRTLNYLENHLHERITLKTIASYVHLNPAYLSRIISKNTGKSFVNLLNNMRIEKAKLLMKTGNYKIYELASNVGFNDPKYFGQVFKKFTGETLQQYSKRIAKRERE